MRKKTMGIFRRMLSLLLGLCMFISIFAGTDMHAEAASNMRAYASSSANYSVSVKNSSLFGYGAVVTYTAPYTGVYRLTSSDSSGDPYVYVSIESKISTVRSAIENNKCKDGVGSNAFYKNDDGGSGLNFDGYVFLEAGKKYGIFYTRYSTSSTSSYTGRIQYQGSTTVNLNKNGGSGGTASLYGGVFGKGTANVGTAVGRRWAASTSSATISSVSVPTKAGCQFLGYYTASTGGTQVIAANGAINETAMINNYYGATSYVAYAQWKVLTQNYKLNNNGGTGTEYTVSVTQGSVMPTRATNTLPTREGYTFDGYWDTAEATGGTKYYEANGTSTFISNVNSGTTDLFARWTANEYSATLNANGGTGSATVKMKYDAALAGVGYSIPAKTGYTFAGYYYNLGEGDEKLYLKKSDVTDQLVNALDGGKEILWKHATDGVQLKAKWIPNTYHIQLFSNDDVYGVDGGSGYLGAENDIEATYGDLYLPTADDLGLRRDHYDFVGWNLYDEQDWQMFLPGTVYKTGLTAVADDTVSVYAAWKMKDNFSITYNSNGGKGGPRNAVVFSGESYTLKSTDDEPTYPNHSFLGWYLSPNGDNEKDVHYRKTADDTATASNTIYDITENITLYARWKTDKTVVYNANGGSFDMAKPIEYHHDGIDVAVKFDHPPTRVGYDFMGWATSPSAETPIYKSGVNETFKMGDEDIILYAVWEKKTYVISYGTEFASLPEGVTATNADGMVLATAVLYKNDYQIKISVDNRRVDSSNMIVTVNDIAISTPNPVVNPDNSNMISYTYTIRSVVNNQKVDISGLETREFSITYVTDGGSFDVEEPTSYTYHDTETVTLVPATKTGYTFDKWYLDAACTSEAGASFAKSSAENKVFYAKWTPITYTIKYDANIPTDIISSNPGCSTTVNADATYGYEDTVTLASKGGMVYKIGSFEPEFLGWSPEADSNVAVYAPGECVSAVASTQNEIVTLYAVWNVPSFKVNFDLYGGHKSGTVDYATLIEKQGTNVSLPAVGSADDGVMPGAPIRDGYTFAGWYNASDADKIIITKIDNIHSNYTVRAKWEAKKFNVTYVVKIPADSKLELNDASSTVISGENSYTIAELTDTAAEFGTDYTFKSFPGYTLVDNKFETAINEIRTLVSDDSDYEVTQDDVDLINAIHAASKTAQEGLLTDIATFKDDIEKIENNEEIEEEEATATISAKKSELDAAILTMWGDTLTALTSAHDAKYAGKISDIYNDCWPELTAESLASVNYTDEVAVAGILPGCNHTSISMPVKTISAKFAGWTRDASAETNCVSGDVASATVMYAAGMTDNALSTGDDVTLYAVFAPDDAVIDHYLSYDVNGGSWTNGVKAIQHGKTSVSVDADINAPSKIGYNFIGWSENGNAPAVSSIDLSSGNKTLKAIYIANQYKVIYHPNDNGYNATLEDGITLTGIYVLGSAGVIDGTMSKNTEQQYTSAPQNIENTGFVYGTTKTLPANPYTSTTQYAFKGWAKSSTATVADYADGEEVLNLAVDNDATVDLYAIWGEPAPFIRFNANGGDGEPEPILKSTVSDVYDIPTANIPSKEGYIFKGWSTTLAQNEAEYVHSKDGAGNDVFTPSKGTFTSATLLYAIWELAPYCTVSYAKPADLSGSVPLDNNRYVKGNVIDLEFNVLPVKVGYHFEGWMKDDKVYKQDPSNPGNSEYTVKAADTEEGNNTLVFTPKMVANKYTIKFYGRDIAEENPIYTVSNIEYGTSITDAQLAALNEAYANDMRTDKEHYTFEGWSLTSGGGVSYANTQEELKNLSVVDGGEVKLYTVITPKKITINIDPTGGTTSLTSIEASYGELLSAIREIPVKTGYNFAGYYDNQGTLVYDATLNVSQRCHYTEDTTLHAEWTAKSYNVIYIYESEILKSSNLQYKDTVEARNTSMAGSEIFNAGVIVKGASKLYGWSANGKNEGVVYKVGSEFKYDLWNNGSDVILYPIIVEDAAATVTYSANGGAGSPVDRISYQIGDRIKVKFDQIPVRDSYEFLGWSIDPNTTIEGDVVPMDGFYPYNPAGTNEYEVELKGSLTLYAVWRIGTYNISYEKNAANAVNASEDVVTQLTVERGHTEIKHAGNIFLRDGYELMGWSNSSSENNAVAYDLNADIDRPLTTRDSIKLYAVWKAKDVSLQFNTLTEESTILDMTVAYDSVYGVLPTPSRVGYSFEGWYKNYNDVTGAYSDQITSTTRVMDEGIVILYAKWSEDVFTINYHPNYNGAEDIQKKHRVIESTVLLDETAFGRTGHNLVGYAISPNGPVAYQVGQELGVNWTTKGTEIQLYCVWDVDPKLDIEVGQSYIYYISNGADGGLAPTQNIASNNSEVVIADNVGNMTKYGHVFVGWNTEPNGDGEAYEPGETVVLNENIKLFAQWVYDEYPLTVIPDQGIELITVTPKKDVYTYDEHVTVTAKVKDGYIWKGFISSDEKHLASYIDVIPENNTVEYSFKMPGVPASLEVVTRSDLTLYANGGKFEDGQIVKNLDWETGEVFDASLLETPTRGNGYRFVGWFLDKNCTKLMTEDTVINGGTALYAGWGYGLNVGEMHVLSVPEMIYTGAKLQPSVIVTDGTRILTENVDYKLSYKNNIKVNKDEKFVADNALVVGAEKIDDSNVDKKLPMVTITGKNNYKGTISLNFNIRPKDISLGDEDPEISLFYDKYLVSSTKDIKMAVSLDYVVPGGKTIALKTGKEVDITYVAEDGSESATIPANATGTYKMKVVAKAGSGFTGSFTRDVVITEAGNAIAAAKVTSKKTPLKPDMTPDDIDLKVKIGSKTLEKNKDYVIEFVNGTPTKPGTYTVYIKAVEGSNYIGMKAVKVVLAAASFKQVKVGMITNAMYTGEDYGDGIVSIVDSGRTLVKGVDYKTSYKGGINAGKVDVLITGLGIYNGATQKVKYTISKYNLSADYHDMITVVEPTSAAEYSVDGARPEFKVLFEGRTLVENVDYTAQFINNKQITSAYSYDKPEIVITGIGNFTGKISGGNFTIVPKTFTQDNLTVVTEPLYYKANATLEAKFKLKEVGATNALVAGRDYDKNRIEYTCNGQKITKIPTIGSVITVKVTGIDNFSGSYTFDMSVAGKAFKSAKALKITKSYTGSEVKLTSEDLGFTYKIATNDEAKYFNAAGTYVKVGDKEPTTTLAKGDVIILAPGRDYDLDNAIYNKNITKGSATAIINGRGFFGGAQTVKYKIVEKPVNWIGK